MPYYAHPGYAYPTHPHHPQYSQMPRPEYGYEVVGYDREGRPIVDYIGSDEYDSGEAYYENGQWYTPGDEGQYAYFSPKGSFSHGHPGAHQAQAPHGFENYQLPPILNPMGGTPAQQTNLGPTGIAALPGLAGPSNMGVPTNPIHRDVSMTQPHQTPPESSTRNAMKPHTEPSGHVMFSERLFDGALVSAGLSGLVAELHAEKEDMGEFEQAVQAVEDSWSQSDET